MPAKVAPNIMPPRTTSSGSVDPSAQKYSTFLDVVLDHVCCAADPNQHPSSGSLAESTHNTAAHQAAYHGRRHSAVVIPPLSLTDSRSFSRTRSLSNSSKAKNNRTRSNSGSLKNRLQETVILPHLRFNPLASSSSSPSKSNNKAGGTTKCPSSSLDDFFTLFLADDAPYSFQLFHEKNGDKNVTITPWKTLHVKDQTAEEDDDENEFINVVESGHDITTKKMERTITFQTKITPGSSSNPLSQSEHTNGNSGERTVIPLGVTITQRLIQLHTATTSTEQQQHQQPQQWILECEFSFDFQSNQKLAGSGGGVFGTGLSQFLMSNAVKGSTVNVTVILTECGNEKSDGTARGSPLLVARRAVSRSSGNEDNAGKRATAASGVDGSRARSDISMSNVPNRMYCGADVPQCNENEGQGFFSCLNHPLLLPPDGLCNASADSRERGHSSKGKKSSTKKKNNNEQYSSILNSESLDEPAQLGASLLSAIKAKNAPRDEVEFSPVRKPDPSLTQSSLVYSRFEGMRESHNKGYDVNQQHEDVLRTSSISSLKMKHIPSFEIGRVPSTATMRRIILEKDVTTANSVNSASASAASSTPAVKGMDSSLVAESPNSGNNNARDSASPTFTQGISMHIEMELSPFDSNQSTTSSISSFSRSTSLSGIDDKVRRGLKKRVARSWISWAESWCMRLWEEEHAAIRAGKRNHVLDKRMGKGNGKRNVRPSVRKIGQPRPYTSSSTTAQNCNKWKPLSREQNSSGRSERWMSLDGGQGGDEIGVEVACTIPSPGRTSATSNNKKDLSMSNGVDVPKIHGGNGGSHKSSKMKKRLLKGLSHQKLSEV